MLKKLEKEVKNYKKDQWKKYDYINLNKAPISREFLGVPIPLLRDFKKGESFTIEHIHEFFTKTSVNEIQTWGLIQIEKLKKEHLVEHKDRLIHFIEHCDNWWISDGLSSFYAHILERDKQFLQTLKKWNTDTNLWKRRQSVVSLFYYSSLRKVHQSFDDSIELIDNLLHDREYYVQKGVGWALRELYNVYPEKTKKFLEKNVESISSHAWQASTEKLAPEFKSKLKLKRKRGT